MVYDTARVAAIRARVAAQIDLIKSPEAKIVKGKLDALKVARNQTEDIKSFFLQDLERQSRTLVEEARWLSSAEHIAPDMGAVPQAERRAFHQTRRQHSDC